MAKGEKSGYWIEYNSNDDSYCLCRDGEENRIRHPKDGIKVVGRLYGLNDEQIESLPIYEAGKEDTKSRVFVESQDIDMVFSLLNRE